MADIKGNDNIKEFSYENSELASIVVNNNGNPITFGKGAPEGSFTVGNASVSANGTYLASDSDYDGFDQVVVDVPKTETEEKSVYYTQNGSYSLSSSTGTAISSASISTNVTSLSSITYITEPDEYVTVSSNSIPYVCFNNGGDPFYGMMICTPGYLCCHVICNYVYSTGNKSLSVTKDGLMQAQYHPDVYILSADKQCVLRAYRFY